MLFTLNIQEFVTMYIRDREKIDPVFDSIMYNLNQGILMLSSFLADLGMEPPKRTPPKRKPPPPKGKKPSPEGKKPSPEGKQSPYTSIFLGDNEEQFQKRGLFLDNYPIPTLIYISFYSYFSTAIFFSCQKIKPGYYYS